jgi:hypothetical protein
LKTKLNSFNASLKKSTDPIQFRKKIESIEKSLNSLSGTDTLKSVFLNAMCIAPALPQIARGETLSFDIVLNDGTILSNTVFTKIVQDKSYFAQADALKGSLTLTLKEVKPTFFFGVPRVWEKIQEKMVQLGREKPAIVQRISAWAQTVGTTKNKNAQFGNNDKDLNSCFCVANVLFKQIKVAVGLEACKACFTAAASAGSFEVARATDDDVTTSASAA